MRSADIVELENLGYFVAQEAQRLNWLRRCNHRDLQLAAIRAWPRYQCALQLYIEGCRAAGWTPEVPFIERPIVMPVEKGRLETTGTGESG